LDAVKMHEDCDDDQARNIELTEEQYLNSMPDWCSKEDWAALCKYWTSEKYKEKRRAVRAARLKSADVAQNRAG
jgi:hypothetical protein